MNEGLPKVIIPKKTVVPYEGEINGEFRTTSPAGIKLNIYAAENEFDSSMRIQKCIEKHFTFPVESGTPFDIKYKINENKAIDNLWSIFYPINIRIFSEQPNFI